MVLEGNQSHAGMAGIAPIAGTSAVVVFTLVEIAQAAIDGRVLLPVQAVAARRDDLQVDLGGRGIGRIGRLTHREPGPLGTRGGEGLARVVDVAWVTHPGKGGAGAVAELPLELQRAAGIALGPTEVITRLALQRISVGEGIAAGLHPELHRIGPRIAGQRGQHESHA